MKTSVVLLPIYTVLCIIQRSLKMDIEEYNRKIENKNWWDSRTLFQRNLIIGVVLAGILAGLLIPLIIYSRHDSQDNENEDADGNSKAVIIIGAGSAGIAAASKLLENDITNVIILEAENRIGGRINSIEFGDGIIDLGAQWCHGEKNNIVYELVKDLDLLEDDPEKKVAIYHSSQKYIDQSFVQQMANIVHDIYNEEKHGVEISLGEYIIQRYNATLLENYASTPKRIALAQDLLNTVHLDVLSNEGAFSWFDISAQSDFEESEGRNSLGWKNRGYKTILDVLTKKYPNPKNELPVKEKLLLSKDVIKISSEGNKSIVRCSDNTTYSADHVIWTPSLAVLKHRYEYVFEPELPNDKVHAIESLGIGAVSKIFFYFPTRWWPRHLDGFVFLWSKRDGQNVWRDFPYGSKTQGKSWLVSILSLTGNLYNPNVLGAWICGEAVPSIEGIPDDIIINGTMFLLNKFLGHQYRNITRPQKIIRENWYSNDHFRGTYSYDTLEAHADGVSQRNVLSLPIETSSRKPLLLFAGEATNPIHFSTVHGAIETGRREADRIINYYKER